MTIYLKVIITNIIILITASMFLKEDTIFYIEKPFLTLNLKLRSAIDSDKQIFIVDIDEKSIQALGKWPWERQKMANLIEALYLYKPQVIGIAILFNERSDSYNDEVFNSVINRVGNVVLASVDLLNIYPFNYVDGDSRKNFSIGFLDIRYDTSGKVMGINPIIKKSGKNYEAFAVAVAKKYNRESINSIKDIDLLRTNFYGPFKTFKHYSAIDFVNNSIKDSIEGNIIIIGTEFTLFANTAFGGMPLSELHANIVQNILDKKWLRFNRTINFITCFAIGFFFYTTTFLYKKHWIPLLIIFIIFLGFSLALFLNGIIISTVSLITISIFNYFIARYTSRGTHSAIFYKQPFPPAKL